MEKTAIVVLADPKSGSEEALGRLFNALAAAYDFKQQNMPVTLFFQGAGTRWAGELANREHPAYQLFAAVKDTVAGVSLGCADVFGARESAVASARSGCRERCAGHEWIAESGSFSGRRLHRSDI